MSNKAQVPGNTYSMYKYATSETSARDNGATVVMGGNIDSSPTVTSAPDMAITGAGREKQPGVQSNAQTGAQKANSSGDFAVLAAGSYIMKGGNVTTNLAGVAYRGLRGAGNQNQIRGIHTLLTRSTVLIDYWKMTAAGVFSTVMQGGNPSSDDFDIGGDYQVPTRALPGSTVALPTGGTPVTTLLPAKTG
jgi:hypothetical protein